jgi:nucleoside-diphosphate-sugar epimerase
MSLPAETSHILITGGTGLFGGALIEHYLTHEPDTRLSVLVRGHDPGEARERLVQRIRSSPTFPPERASVLLRRVTAIPGDFIKQNLGLSSLEISKLRHDVTDIIHSGASVDFGLALNEARIINVHGTKNMLDFALSCSKLHSFLHISTGHVAGKRSGTIMENEISTGQGFFNSYEQTKAESELLVRDYADKLPITVNRLTTVIGDYTTGYIRQFGFFHNSLRLLAQGLIPFLAGDKNGHLDLIPTEYPVRAVYYLHRKNYRPGTTYHISCGPERSFTLEEFLHETICHFRLSFSDRSLISPEIVTKDEFDVRIAQSASTRLRNIMHALGTFSGHLTVPKIFDQTNTLRDLAGSEIGVPSIRSYYFKVLDECVNRKFGKQERLN